MIAVVAVVVAHVFGMLTLINWICGKSSKQRRGLVKQVKAGETLKKYNQNISSYNLSARFIGQILVPKINDIFNSCSQISAIMRQFAKVHPATFNNAFLDLR